MFTCVGENVCVCEWHIRCSAWCMRCMTMGWSLFHPCPLQVLSLQKEERWSLPSSPTTPAPTPPKSSQSKHEEKEPDTQPVLQGDLYKVSPIGMGKTPDLWLLGNPATESDISSCLSSGAWGERGKHLGRDWGRAGVRASDEKWDMAG